MDITFSIHNASSYVFYLAFYEFGVPDMRMYMDDTDSFRMKLWIVSESEIFACIRRHQKNTNLKIFQKVGNFSLVTCSSQKS